MRRTWFLIESTQGLELALERAKTAGGPAAGFLCSSPGGLYAARHRDLAVHSLHEYLSHGEQNAVCEALEPVVRQLCRELDRELHRAVPGLPSAFRPFDAMEFQLKAVLDALAIRFHQLRGFIEAENPVRLIFRSPPRRGGEEEAAESLESSRQPLAWRSHESAAAALLRRSGWQESGELAIDESPLEPEPGQRPVADPTEASTLEGLLGRLINLNLATGLLRLGLGGRGLRGKRPLTVASRSEEIVAFIRRGAGPAGYPVDWWSRLELDPVSMRSGRVVRTDSSREAVSEPRWSPETIERLVQKAWTAAARDLPEPPREAARARLARYAGRRVPVLLRLFTRAVAYLEQRRPRTVLTGTRVSDAVQVLSQACDATATRLVSFQHGGNIGYNEVERLRRSDLKGRALYATFGPGVTRHLRAVVRENELETEPVTLGWRRPGGRSARPARPPARRLFARGEAQPLLLYVATRYLGDLRHGSGHWYDDVSYFLHQAELLEVLAGLGRTRTVVKLHGKEHLESPLPTVAVERRLDLEIVKQGKLSDWLRRAAIVLIDYPSTTLLEALALERRVLYLDLGVVPWFAAAARELRRSARWVARDGAWPQGIAEAVEEALGEEWPLDPGAFCRQYSAPRYTPAELLAAIEEPRGRRAATPV